MSDGRNLPGFQAAQLEFAAHIRDPEQHPRPDDVEPRRMQIYLDLVYRNIENLIAHAFPLAKGLLGGEADDGAWHPLVRGFVASHSAESPYFLEVSQEFLEYLGGLDLQARALPPWLLELCHYEWVELAVAVSDETLPQEVADRLDPGGDLLGAVVVSPLVWPLAYQYPVHEIGPDHQPAPLAAGEAAPTYLVCYRTDDDRVKFMASNVVTHRLLDALMDGATGAQALAGIAEALPDVDSQTVHDQGVATLGRLRDAGILLGALQAGD